MIGFAPEGNVYFHYRVSADRAGGTGGLLRYTAEAASDMDGDGDHSFYAYVKPAEGDATGMPGALPGTTCAGSGVQGAGASDALMTAGPCDTNSGFSEF